MPPAAATPTQLRPPRRRSHPPPRSTPSPAASSSMSADQYVAAHPSYSLDDAIRSSIAAEATHGYLDLGPVDVLDPEVLEAEYNIFYGTSPLSSPSPSPSPSRSASPRREQQQEQSVPFGTSPLSSPPSSRPASPAFDPRLQPSLTSKERRNRKKGHANRRRKRQEARAKQDGSTAPYPNGHKHISRAQSTPTAFDTDDIPSASSGFIALPDSGAGSSKVHELRELLADEEIKLIKWNGTIERAIVNKDGRVIAVLAGCPNDTDWATVHRSAHSALRAARARCKFPKKTTRHRRGDFPALNAGISFGGGQKLPGNLYHSKQNAKELEGLLAHDSFKRIAGFANKAFLTWAPKLHGYYAKNMKALLTNNPGLRRNFDNSIWASAAFNFGPKTCTRKHRDFANLPFGWCGITSLGDFDPTKGGHLILWDLKLVIEFPPGSTILLPSAAIAHSNTNIGRRETRCSFTQFSAGGLFRWTEHGCQKDADFFRGMSTTDKDRVAADNEARCKLGLQLFSSFEEIEEMLGMRPEIRETAVS